MLNTPTPDDLKIYYSISEVAQRFGVAESLLRYWEQKFPQIKPRKAGRGVRQYTKEDLKVIEAIYNLVKVRGMKLDAACQVLNKNKDGQLNVSEAINRLKSVRASLVKLRTNLSHLSEDSELDLNF